MSPGTIEMVLMRQLASYLAVPILIVNGTFDLVFFNESAEPILGRRFEETGEIRRGEWIRQFQPTYENGVPIPPHEQPLTRAIELLQPCHTRFSLKGLDSVKRVIEGVAFPLLTRASGLIGAAGIFWEVGETTEPTPLTSPGPAVSSRTRQEIEVFLLRRLADRLQMPIFVEDAEGRLSFYNEAAEPLIGRPFEEIGTVALADWNDTFRPTDENGLPIKAEDHPLGVARLQQKPCYRRFQYQGLDGVQHRVDATAFPLTGQCNRHLGAVGIFWEGAS
jgi:PAS domain-containing protein